MTTSSKAVTASDPWEMALIHRVIRRGFEQAREHVLAAGADVPGCGRGGVHRISARRIARPSLE